MSSLKTTHRLEEEDNLSTEESKASESGKFLLSWDEPVIGEQEIRFEIYGKPEDDGKYSTRQKMLAFNTATQFHAMMVNQYGGSLVANLFDQNETCSFVASFNHADGPWSNGGAKNYLGSLTTKKISNSNISGGESKAQEEGMGSVSGPPAGTEPTVREEEDNTFVLPADSSKEGIPSRDMKSRTAKKVPQKDLADRELDQTELGEVLETDSIMLNESYLQLGDVLYRPLYVGESLKPQVEFEGRLYTSEGVGNCEFCKGAGKITVERLGLKECPDCDGTGDVQGNPMLDTPFIGDVPDPEISQEPEVPEPNPMQEPDKEQKKPNPFAKNGESRKRALERSHIEARDDYLSRDLNEISELQEAKDFLHDVESLEGYMNDLDRGDAGLRALAEKLKGMIKEAEEFTESKKKAKEGKYHYTVYVSPQGMERMYTGFVDASSEEDAKAKATDKITKSAGMKPESVSIISTESKKKSNEGKYADPICKICNKSLYNVMGSYGNVIRMYGESVDQELSKNIQKDIIAHYKSEHPDESPDSLLSEQGSLYNAPVRSINLYTSESKKKANEEIFGHMGLYDKGECKKCGKDYLSHPMKGETINRGTGKPFEIDHVFDEPEPEPASESCKPCRKIMSHEANVSKFKRFVSDKIDILQKRAKAGESVSLMYGMPTVERQGRKIKGTLAYAGVSLNDRIYLPEELAKGDGLTLPLLLNHSSIAGAEDELDRLDDTMLDALYTETDYEIGEVTLTWDPAKLTLFYTGVVENEFFQKEIDDMDMAVSLGIYYDSDSPRVCDVNCYTLIKGAEFREVSLVYHAGFPIATIEAVEAQLKKRALSRIAKEDHFSLLSNLQEDEQAEGDKESVNDIQEIVADVEEETVPKESEEGTNNLIGDGIKMASVGEDALTDGEEAVAEEETDELARGGSVDVEEIQDEGPPPTIDLNDEWGGQTIVTEMFTPDNFSVRGVMGMTISNANGVERYTFDPTMNYGTNTIHFDTYDKGATIYGESLQPKMGTPDELTKIIEAQPDIVVEDSDKDAFESVKKNQKKR